VIFKTTGGYLQNCRYVDGSLEVGSDLSRRSNHERLARYLKDQGSIRKEKDLFARIFN
jgi:hypothetical protein